ncbi:MAG: hypothetical protein M3Q42_09490 [Pseudomonadota bacterium]|nr:hypothetical protein [Pseudomonadota bacterium]
MGLQAVPIRKATFGIPGLALSVVLTTLTACASHGDASPMGQPLVLVPGQQVKLPDSSLLRFIGISADSRCPPDVQCVRAGDADVVVGLAAHGAPTRSTTINTQRPEADIGRWHVRVLSLQHGAMPQLTLQVDERQR